MTKSISEGPVSAATVRNWEKLNTNSHGRLQKRANKRRSQKRIIPLEYFTNPLNISVVKELIEFIETENYSTEAVIYSISKNLLNGAGISHKAHARKVLDGFPADEIPELLQHPLPEDETDILGLIYQCLLSEGSKNCAGSYYTPERVSRNMTKGLDFSHDEIFLDPCCGSGAFLLAQSAPDPLRIYGIDSDPVAVFIAKVNLLLKYPGYEFEPQILRADYLSSEDAFKNKEFDYIVTNPPWGAMADKSLPEITSKETFSCFFVKAFRQLKNGGMIRFLFPEAILKVKAHRDIRSFLLTHGSIESITAYSDSFTGVSTGYVDISVRNQPSGELLTYHSNNSSRQIRISTFKENKNLVFNLLTETDTEIIEKVRAKGAYTLENSVWALGIVTGDNKNKLRSQAEPGLEAIYTGKEIGRYALKPPKNYLFYDRSQLQQVAKEEICRAPEKLVYKFISNKPVFAYDNAQSLFLNSANMLIPHIPGMTAKTVLAFLNSELYQFLYIKLFGEVKILKGNLMQLPFPSIGADANERIFRLADNLINDYNIGDEDQLQEEIYGIFSINDAQKQYIRSVLYGKDRS